MVMKRAGSMAGGLGTKWIAGIGLAAFALLALLSAQGGQPMTRPEQGKKAPADGYVANIRPLIKKYCLGCHSTQAKRGDLDLERFAAPDDVRKDLKPWLGVVEHLDVGDMPPKGMPQPTSGEKQQILDWVHGFLDAEGRARSGDPGYVPLRRLSNTEYNCTIRDLTGVDLQPAKEFPADGAAGEGFTNAAEALTDISPTLLNKYFHAAKDVADHAVLLPDGFRFAPTKTRRDWTDESTARLRAFLAAYSGPDGRLPFPPYLAATVRYRAPLLSGKITLNEVATKEKLNPKYLGILWQTLTDKTPSYPLDVVRAHWRQATEKDVSALTDEVTDLQKALWRVVNVGSYIHTGAKGYEESTTRQVAQNPAPTEAQSLRVALKPAPGQSEIVLYLASHELVPGGAGPIVWHRPRFEAAGKPPLLLRDYAQFGPAYEINMPALFAHCADYLAAAAEAASVRSASAAELAGKHGLDARLLERWMAVLAFNPAGKNSAEELPGRAVPPVALELLDEQIPADPNRPAIRGWRKKGTDLPALLTNASDKVEHIPGTASPHGVVVHPTPTEFVAVTWKSPISGTVRVAAKVQHAHPDCGNGIAWWLEQRRGERAAMFAEGAVALGGQATPEPRTLKVEKGDLILLAIDAKNGDHSCDLTNVSLNITRTDMLGGTWDLARDIADSVLTGNPHSDRSSNPDVWRFVRGPSRPVQPTVGPVIPPTSVLGRWRDVAVDPKRQAEATSLAQQAQKLLSGARPAGDNNPDRILYDHLVSFESPLIQGVDASRIARLLSGAIPFGMLKERFDAPGDDTSMKVGANSIAEIRLPAALFQDREFVVEGALAPSTGDRAALFQVTTSSPGLDLRWDGKSSVVTSPTGTAYKQLLQGCDQFRRCFPLFISFPPVIPNDEVVSLKMFHREDEPLSRLFLNTEQARRLDSLWAEHQFISRQPVAENNYLPLFIGFVTQDQPKEMVTFFEGQRPAFRRRAEAFEKEELAAIPKQLETLLAFANRAYRRPLRENEKTELLDLYRTLETKGVSHEEALRGVLARILVAPAFLFRIETPSAGKAAGPVNDWELATRLSYFLWASAPDTELRRLADQGLLHDPKILADQTRRMLQDDRIRSLATEFGAQWIQVRGFDALNEKNEQLFPTFDAALREAIYEETILFFQDLFQSDRQVTDILDTDYTYLNERLAKHYGIPGVTGPQWRRVGGVRQYGRGGILGLASVQAKESGASRTSPVLRGNWVVETLLGEKLPRPPANVPKIPEAEGGDGLTVRQQVEKHARVPECAVCHQRIDPFGFALERYDPIGRWREKDLSGLPVDARAKLKDGTEFEGIEGLRNYLLTKKKDVVVRLFCRRLLGYALGRAVSPSDQPMIDTLVSELNRNHGRISAAVQAITRSQQFRMIRGKEYADNR